MTSKPLIAAVKIRKKVVRFSCAITPSQYTRSRQPLRLWIASGRGGKATAFTALARRSVHHVFLTRGSDAHSISAGIPHHRDASISAGHGDGSRPIPSRGPVELARTAKKTESFGIDRIVLRERSVQRRTRLCQHTQAAAGPGRP